MYRCKPKIPVQQASNGVYAVQMAGLMTWTVKYFLCDRPIYGDKVKNCISCKTCSIMSGFGGAGAFSDGKYNITNDFGGTLYEHIGKKKAIELMEYVDKINMKFGGEGTKLYSTAAEALRSFVYRISLIFLTH